MTGHFATAGGVRVHYLEFPGGSPALVLLPGLSATASMFQDLVEAGLSPKFRVIAIDLRGRGESDAPAAGFDALRPAANYTMADHAADVLGLLDALELHKVVLVGHSFGGMLTLYLAANHPGRFERIVVLDAAPAVATPETREVLRPMLASLGVVVSSWQAYLTAVQQLPYLLGRWQTGLERYFKSYVQIAEDGTVRQLVKPEAILAAVEGVLAEDWPGIVASIHQPVLLVNATEPFGSAGSPPFLLPEHAQSTARALKACRYLAVPGNHITMIFGEYAQTLARAICDFAAGTSEPG